ncbi:hypothetical protein GCM10022275_29060 [Tessaracoccus defluvii]
MLRLVATHNGGMEADTQPHALLCARDPRVIEAVEVSAAALAVDLVVVHDAEAAAEAWPRAALRLVGADVAARWAGLPGSGGHVTGTDAVELARCSARLGVPVVPLPDEAGRLAALLTAVAGADRGDATVVAVAAGSGGLGASTLVAGLVLAAARRGRRAAAVDLDPAGGGLDLVVGAEAVPGYRWSDLAKARGELGEIWESLPRVGGAAFLAVSREAPGAPPQAAVDAVLGALRRVCDLVVIDAGSTPLDGERHLLLVGSDVRSIAAAQMRADSVPRAPVGAILRTGRGRGIPPAMAARSLGLGLVGVLRDDRTLPRLAELGLPPSGLGSRRFSRDVTRIEAALHG